MSIGDPTVWITTVLGRLTPALGELLIFLASLVFFIAGRTVLRRQLILAMPAHSSRLKAIRAFGAIENGLAVYFGATALVYAGVAAATALATLICGLGNPLLWGAMTFVAAYIPYFGVTLITIALAATGALTYPHSILALAPALAYLTIHVGAELAIIPWILGRRHEINPFLIFISIVFWTWMWGPVGAVLAVPLLVTMHSLMAVVAAEETYLP
jgi:predicted PurR-regulated permease PerM